MRRLFLILLCVLLLSGNTSMLIQSTAKFEEEEATTDYTQDANCVGAWLLNSNTTDESSQSNDGTNHGADIVEGSYYGDCYDFIDENLDYIEIDNSSAESHSLDLLGDFSLVAWVYPDELNWGEGTQYHAIIAKRDGADYQFEFRFVEDDLNLLTSGGSLGTSTNTATGAWVHVAVTRDADGNTIFYTNGSDTGDSAASKTIAHKAANVTIGATATYGHYFDGKIDEVAIFTRVLNSTEINEMKDSGIKGDQ